MALPTIMIYLLLMWIGASPGSTGGGIKTTTAGVAFLNMVAILRGQDRTEFFRSEISHQSVRRAFAIIISSFLVIGTGIFIITFKDSDKGLISIAFEVFSAFSTVGLSLGITPSLSTVSKNSSNGYHVYWQGRYNNFTGNFYKTNKAVILSLS
jgi:Trk-type K+ transport system membrane component